jgi:predicted dehydrogenase
MVDAARNHGVFLMEAMWSRFLPAYGRLSELLAERAIGEALVVEADFGFRVPLMPDHRLFDPQLGGGALLDVGVYPVQLSSLVLGPPDRVSGDGVVGITGVDEQVAAVLHHPGGGLGVVQAALRVPLACRARISGSGGWIDLPAPMHDPRAINVGTDRLECDYDGDGLRFQVEEVHRCLAEGLVESPVMPLDETITIMTTLDTIRTQLGVTYPGD